MDELWYTLIYSRDEGTWYAEITDRFGQEVATTNSNESREDTEAQARAIIKGSGKKPIRLNQLGE